MQGRKRRETVGFRERMKVKNNEQEEELKIEAFIRAFL